MSSPRYQTSSGAPYDSEDADAGNPRATSPSVTSLTSAFPSPPQPEELGAHRLRKRTSFFGRHKAKGNYTVTAPRSPIAEPITDESTDPDMISQAAAEAPLPQSRRRQDSLLSIRRSLFRNRKRQDGDSESPLSRRPESRSSDSHPVRQAHSPEVFDDEGECEPRWTRVLGAAEVNADCISRLSSLEETKRVAAVQLPAHHPHSQDPSAEPRCCRREGPPWSILVNRHCSKAHNSGQWYPCNQHREDAATAQRLTSFDCSITQNSWGFGRCVRASSPGAPA